MEFKGLTLIGVTAKSFAKYQ